MLKKLPINLNNVKMVATHTAATGVVNHETIFHFSQNGQVVTAEYEGGKIVRGYLIGVNQNNQLNFTYCQLQTDMRLDHGSSKCELSVSVNGRITLIENFEWGSRNGERGANIFEEVD